MGRTPYAARVERTQTRPWGPRTAVVWAALSRDFSGGPARDVLDVGGGTGGFAVPLAEQGHRVTVVDPSPDALAALTRRAADAGVADRIVALQGDADRLTELIDEGSADLALCHSVLEFVEDAPRVASGLVAALRPGGVASVLVANRAAAVLSRALAGHLAEATAILLDPRARTGPADRVRQRFDAADATALLEAVGLVVEKIHGVRVVADLLPGAVADGDAEALLRFELAAADRAPYRDFATQLHLYARKPL